MPSTTSSTTFSSLLHMPSRLYKYYSFNKKYTEGRLSGSVYLSTPLDFNDPCDCQLSIDNNTKKRVHQKDEKWLEYKLEELGYAGAEIKSKAENLLRDDEATVYGVYKSQLERLGVLCLSGTYSDTLMWGYYANNEGYCIEYDTDLIVERLVIGFVNRLDYKTTELLYVKEDYKKNPLLRKLKNKPTREQQLYIRRFDASILPAITNTFLLSQGDNGAILNFVQNAYIKRFAGGSIKYTSNLKASQPTLFFDSRNAKSKTKYFRKTSAWKHEKEFRIVVSLGGKMGIDMGKDTIKNVYLGFSIHAKGAKKIAVWMDKLGVDVPLYIMRKADDYSLCAEQIEKDMLISLKPKKAEEYLKQLRKLKW